MSITYCKVLISIPAFAIFVQNVWRNTWAWCSAVYPGAASVFLHRPSHFISISTKLGLSFYPVNEAAVPSTMILFYSLAAGKRYFQTDRLPLSWIKRQPHSVLVSPHNVAAPFPDKLMITGFSGFQNLIAFIRPQNSLTRIPVPSKGGKFIIKYLV